jgi:RNA polymerase sigma-70 factor, ECF subfamily
MLEKFANRTDEELFGYLKSKDRTVSRQAFDEIYSRYANKIYTYCRKVLNSSNVSEDIFQDIFIKFYESVQKIDEMSNVQGYLIRIARNLCLNEKTRGKISKVTFDESHYEHNDTSIENNEIADILHTSLDALPEDFREVIVMKEFMDMSYKDIAFALDVTVSVVRIRIFRGKQKLREIMTPYINDIQNEN